MKKRNILTLSVFIVVFVCVSLTLCDASEDEAASRARIAAIGNTVEELHSVFANTILHVKVSEMMKIDQKKLSGVVTLIDQEPESIVLVYNAKLPDKIKESMKVVKSHKLIALIEGLMPEFIIGAGRSSKFTVGSVKNSEGLLYEVTTSGDNVSVKDPDTQDKPLQLKADDEIILTREGYIFIFKRM